MKRLKEAIAGLWRCEYGKPMNGDLEDHLVDGFCRQANEGLMACANCRDSAAEGMVLAYEQRSRISGLGIGGTELKSDRGGSEGEMAAPPSQLWS